MEFRWNTVDQSAGTFTITRKDLNLALEAIARAINSDSFFITNTGI